MRMYMAFPEAKSEIARDLKEMGIIVHPQTYQNKNIAEDPEFSTFELQNYCYGILSANPTQLNPTQPWADAEFAERISGQDINPGEAWKLRPEVWNNFIKNHPADSQDQWFDYTYAGRLNSEGINKIQAVIDRIKVDPDSRQLYINIWDTYDILHIGGELRVPCSLGYHVMVRRGALHLTYFQRSCDFATHMENDMYLACKLQEYIAQQTGYPMGVFTHFIASLHVFQKDVADVF